MSFKILLLVFALVRMSSAIELSESYFHNSVREFMFGKQEEVVKLAFTDKLILLKSKLLEKEEPIIERKTWFQNIMKRFVKAEKPKPDRFTTIYGAITTFLVSLECDEAFYVLVSCAGIFVTLKSMLLMLSRYVLIKKLHTYVKEFVYFLVSLIFL